MYTIDTQGRFGFPQAGCNIEIITGRCRFSQGLALIQHLVATKHCAVDRVEFQAANVGVKDTNAN